MPDTIELLRVWEQGVGASAASRALLLLSTASMPQEAEVLAHWNIGRRDRQLLNLRDALFGQDVRCLADCPSCGETIELDFRVDDIRIAHGEPGQAYRAAADGYEVEFRLPDSTDLLAIEGAAPADAEGQLLARCVLAMRAPDHDVGVAALPPPVLAAVSQRMSEVDPQAEILLDVSCPACSAVSPAPFDIVSHLWAELDAWARCMLREVHALAGAYGWSEAEILRMSAARRQIYLDLVAG